MEVDNNLLEVFRAANALESQGNFLNPIHHSIALNQCYDLVQRGVLAHRDEFGISEYALADGRWTWGAVLKTGAPTELGNFRRGTMMLRVSCPPKTLMLRISFTPALVEVGASGF